MPDTTIRVSGDEALVRKLLQDLAPALSAGAQGVAEALRNELTPYPPASAANQSGQRRWYQRGYGPRWTRRDGSVGGAKTSQQLNRSWAVLPNGTTARLIGRAAYSGVVHRKEDQARFHARRGWHTDEDSIKALRRKQVIERVFRAVLRKLLEPAP